MTVSNFDFLPDLTREEYDEIRKLYPEDGSEYTSWQKFPKLPEPRKTIIVLNGHDCEFDEVIFREGNCYDSFGVEKSFLRHQYYYDEINYYIHYWMYAPDISNINDIRYNVGD